MGVYFASQTLIGNVSFGSKADIPINALTPRGEWFMMLMLIQPGYVTTPPP
jgi:hypothetical protein